MALRLADCDRMIAAAGTASTRRRRSPAAPSLMIAQCIRFWPQYEKIKEMVDAGEIGRVQFSSLRRLAAKPVYSTGNWLMDHRKSGGALLDLHVHDVDFAHYLLGVPERVAACGSTGPSGGIDHVVATYHYGPPPRADRHTVKPGAARAPGCYAVIEGGWMFHAPWPFEMAITVVGERGTLDWTMSRGPELFHYAGEAAPRRIPVADGTGWTRELDYFIDCVLAGRPVERCTPTSSRMSIGLALLEERAIRTGRFVRLPRHFATHRRHRQPARPARR
jgi:predicted dehydrogenase